MKYRLFDTDLHQLFDSSVSPISFSENCKEYIPEYGSIIYTVWDKNRKFIYVGIGGLGRSPDSRRCIPSESAHSPR